MQSKIRPFEERDEDPVVALSLRAWAPVFASLERVLGPSGVYARMHPDWRLTQQQAVSATCRGDESRVWVAESDTGVVGFCAVQLDPESGIGEIHMLAVDPDHQRLGIGSDLTRFALEWLRDNGMTVAMVETGGDEGHAPARHAYEQAGFVQLPVARYFKTL